VWEGNWGTDIVFCKKLGRDLKGGILHTYHWERNILCVRLLTGNTISTICSIRILSVVCGCV